MSTKAGPRGPGGKKPDAGGQNTDKMTLGAFVETLPDGSELISIKIPTRDEIESKKVESQAGFSKKLAEELAQGLNSVTTKTVPQASSQSPSLKDRDAFNKELGRQALEALRRATLREDDPDKSKSTPEVLSNNTTLNAGVNPQNSKASDPLNPGIALLLYPAGASAIVYVIFSSLHLPNMILSIAVIATYLATMAWLTKT